MSLTEAQQAGLVPWLDEETHAVVQALNRKTEALRLLGLGGRAARGLVREGSDPDLWITIRTEMAEAGLKYHES